MYIPPSLVLISLLNSINCWFQLEVEKIRNSIKHSFAAGIETS